MCQVFKVGDKVFSDRYEILKAPAPSRGGNAAIKTTKKHTFVSYKAKSLGNEKICYLKVLGSLENREDSSDRHAIFQYIAKKMVALGRTPSIENVEDRYPYTPDTIGGAKSTKERDISYVALEWIGDYYHNLHGNATGLASKDDFDGKTFLEDMLVFAEALSVAHKQNCPHGTLMWRYLFRNTKNEPVLAGFGHAASYSPKKEEAESLISDNGAGYLCKEQLTIKDRNNTRGFTLNGDSVEDTLLEKKKKLDIWHFGATMYHLLTGETIHKTDDLKIAKKSIEYNQYLNRVEKNLHGLIDKKKITEYIKYIITQCVDQNGDPFFATIDELCNSLKNSICLYNLRDYVPSINKEMRDLENKCLRIAASGLPALILGKTGTGKEIFANLIKEASPRSDKVYIPRNFGAIPRDTADSELFGHLKGAFTGAVDNRIGLFEACNEGTLFLDEIGELPHDLQVKLLRTIENDEIIPMGANTPTKVNVRLLAATNEDLEAMIKEKTFREDLYYRLNVLSVELPDLKDRKEDIPKLVNKFFKRQLNKNISLQNISSKAMGKLVAYSWPGNIRELQNTIDRAVTLSSDKEELGPDDFDLKESPAATNSDEVSGPSAAPTASVTAANETVEGLKQKIATIGKKEHESTQEKESKLVHWEELKTLFDGRKDLFRDYIDDLRGAPDCDHCHILYAIKFGLVASKKEYMLNMKVKQVKDGHGPKKLTDGNFKEWIRRNAPTKEFDKED